MLAKHAKFIRVQVDGIVHIFEMSTIKPGSMDVDKPALCPCCHVPMTCVLDITQYGFFEDKFILLFVCTDCGKAYWYSYTLGAYELTELSITDDGQGETIHA